jgi:hypothetical protein
MGDHVVAEDVREATVVATTDMGDSSTAEVAGMAMDIVAEVMVVATATSSAKSVARQDTWHGNGDTATPKKKKKRMREPMWHPME